MGKHLLALSRVGFGFIFLDRVDFDFVELDRVYFGFVTFFGFGYIIAVGLYFTVFDQY